jgi:hypothetical protein
VFFTDAIALAGLVQPDYGWRRYTDIVYVQFAIPFSSYKALEAAEPYRHST